MVCTLEYMSRKHFDKCQYDRQKTTTVLPEWDSGWKVQGFETLIYWT